MEIIENKVYTLEGCAKILKISETSVRVRISSGQLKRIRGLHKVRVLGSELLKYSNK